MDTITIPTRFNGPDGSGHGGYTCGLVAAFVDGPAWVRLHQPPPLETALTVRPATADAPLQVEHGGQVIATAGPATLEAEVPAAPSYERAAEARERYAGLHEHIYPRCVACGPEREPGDGLRIFAGAVQGRPELVACAWHPRPADLDAAGNLRPELAWAALDCPSYFALRVDGEQGFLLGQMAAALEPEIPGGEPLVVYAWARGVEGRKYLAAAALADTEGRVWARAEHVWIASK